MSTFTKATVVLGAVTETETLRKTVHTIAELCTAEDVAEIIIGHPPKAVTKECLAVINELAAEDFPFPVIPCPDKRPFLSSILDAVDIAKGSHIILCPSDMALDLKCIPEMIESAKRDPDIIASSSRFLPGCTLYEYGTIKSIINRCAQLYMRILYGVKLTDFTNPYQIAPRELYLAVNFEETGFPFLLEMILKPLRLGYKFREIPTNCYPRTEGKSRNSKKQMAMYLKTSLHIRFMKKKDILLHPIGE
ncbi:MAG: glycosyltransferase [Clostridia bacterium]|nr:glycosyltransferase [Clostridia bacterium]